MKKRIIALFLLSVVLMLTLTEPVFAVEYQYDALHRLVKVEYDDGSTVSYTYDGNGNIISTTVEGAPTPECRHVFTYNVDPIYLASPATATKAATYYYSCELCGKVDKTHTFSYGEPLEAPQIPTIISQSWSWQTDEDPSATLTLLWSDGKSEQLTATVSLVTSTDTEFSYSASVSYDGVEYQSQKTVQRIYHVTLINGEFVSGEKKDGYSFGDKIAVQAKSSSDLEFAGWYIGDTLISNSEIYSRCVTEDITLEAKFAEKKIEILPTVNISGTVRTYDAASDKYKTTLSLDWSMPSGYELVQAGIYRAYSQSNMTADEITAFGSVSVSTLKNNNGLYTANLSMGSGKKDFDLYYVGYTIYRNENGQEKTIFTEVGCNERI